MMKKTTLLMLTVFITITLQAQDKLLSSIYEVYDGETWYNYFGSNYEYDGNDNLIAETSYLFDENTDSWQADYKIIYTYNINNKVTEELFLLWSTTTNTFENAYKDIYTYNNDIITGIISESWENSSWVNDAEYVITNNVNNLPDTILYYEWDGMNWVNNERTTATYNVDNKLISNVAQLWNGSEWVNVSQISYTYNSNNKMINQIGENWDGVNSVWVEDNGTDYEFDANGNRVLKEDSYNNTLSTKEEYTYDTANLMSIYAHPFKDKTGFDYETQDFPYVNKLLINNRYLYNTSTSSWNLTERTTFNYNSALTLSNEKQEIVGAAISVYPNPTKDFLSIKNDSNVKIEKIRISDLTGKVILHQNQNTMPINVQHLAKGMYVLELFVGDKKELRKFIKK